ncbi:MAG: rod shape-determining protein [Deltaproteobacteria bacterium]|nr:rod shape-determining protein [Deltaproteobacteria bacterium]
MFRWFRGLFSNDLAIDLGTSNTRIFAKGQSIITNEPTVVAVSRDHTGARKVSAVGRAAKEMVGRTPTGIEAIRPMRNGVIADFESVSAMLRFFIKSASGNRGFSAPRIIICVPGGVTEVEKRAVREAVSTAGAREVFLIEEPMAAAIGANLPITEPSGNMIVDVGGGRTEVAVISLSGTVFSNSVRVGGEKMDEAIIQYVKRRYSLLLGEQTAEEVKKRLGSASPSGQLEEMEIKGRDVVGGVPKSVVLNSDEVREALAETVSLIVEAVRFSLERTPPELAADIVDRGIVLAGGGALLKNLDVLLREETGLPVMVCDDPMCAAVRGSGLALDKLDLLEEIAVA